jgi:hypothetical protein
MADYVFLALPVALACAVTALLMRYEQRRIAGAITAGLAITAMTLMVIAYTSDDDYSALFAFLIGQLTGLFALGGLIGIGVSLIGARYLSKRP